MGLKILGINSRHYPTQVGSIKNRVEENPIEDWSADPPRILAVLVAGEIGDYACYVGIGEPEWVAANGDKLRFAEAQCHFPSIKEGSYRGP